MSSDSYVQRMAPNMIILGLIGSIIAIVGAIEDFNFETPYFGVVMAIVSIGFMITGAILSKQ